MTVSFWFGGDTVLERLVAVALGSWILNLHRYYVIFCRNNRNQQDKNHKKKKMNQMAVAVRRISNCTVKPFRVPEEAQNPCYLTPWDLQFLTFDYIQTGLLFPRPQHLDTESVLNRLKHTLSRALTEFYPLSGRLVTKKNHVPTPYTVFLDCKDAPGVTFVHAVSDATISDILSPVYVPAFVESLFPLDRPINHDAHTLPVLAVQTTEVVDGIFIGCSLNHAVADGSSFWHFLNSWSELARSTQGSVQSVLRPPITKRWFINEQGPVVNIPFSHPDEFIERYVPDPFRERIFHFGAESIAKLKAKANADMGTSKISSFQALAAHVWRSVTRARGVSGDQKTKLVFPIDVRSRLDPPLPKEYFGNCIFLPSCTTTAGEMLSNSLGWTAWLLNREIISHTNDKVRSCLESSVVPIQLGKICDPLQTVAFGMSARFDVYTNDFGWGKPVAVRSGFGLKFDCKVTWYPGRDGGGSTDLEICLFAQTMEALESDDEFMSAVSPHPAW